MASFPQQSDNALTFPAATVIIFRRAPTGGPPQILMVIRSAGMRFAAGAAVFPGGRVDEADRQLATKLHPDAADPEDVAARIAGARETLEEAGLLIGVPQTVSAADVAAARARLLECGTLEPVLEQFGWTLDLSRLEPFARWNPKFERSFDTRFYLADLGTGAVSLDVDGTEHSHLLWVTPAEALAMADRGELRAIFPTRCNLQRLAQFADFAAAVSDARTYPPTVITPWIDEREGRRWLNIPPGLGYPQTSAPLEHTERT